MNNILTNTISEFRVEKASLKFHIPVIIIRKKLMPKNNLKIYKIEFYILQIKKMKLYT